MKRLEMVDKKYKSLKYNDGTILKKKYNDGSLIIFFVDKMMEV
jgi:hypothetical protein